MEAYRTKSGIGIPLDSANVDTDQIIPARFLLKPRSEDFGPLLFCDLRFGQHADPHFVFNDPRYAGACFIVGNINFGCGSSREQAPYALWDYGIRAVIAPSFGDIFRLNCVKNGIVPAIVSPDEAAALRAVLREQPGSSLTVDLEAQTIVDRAGRSTRFEIDAQQRDQLLRGEDDISRTLRHAGRLDSFERRHSAESPWAVPRQPQ
jgi:3-isopropylmalate/(R)-2-methylmalate dehydratase small subunit